jgi:hypothetical protein
MDQNELLKLWEDSVKGLEQIADAMKNDNGKRVAFVYIGDKREYPVKDMDYLERANKSEEIGKEILPYDDRQWAMVDQEDGNGAKLMLIDQVLPSVEDARRWGYKEEDYKPVGAMNLYSDILGFYSEFNNFKEPALKDDTIDKAVQGWYMRSCQDDKNIIEATKIHAEYSAKSARKKFEDFKP